MEEDNLDRTGIFKSPTAQTPSLFRAGPESEANREEDWGEVDLLPDAPEKHRQEVAIVGSMSVRRKVPIFNWFQNSGDLQTSLSHNDVLSKPRQWDLI